MRKMKKFLALGAAVLVLGGGVTANGMTLQYIGMGSGATAWIEGYNSVGVKGCGLYGTNTSKVVIGCKVKLIEGNYNQSADNYAKKGGWTAKLSKINNPFNTAYTSYSWKY